MSIQTRRDLMKVLFGAAAGVSLGATEIAEAQQATKKKPAQKKQPPAQPAASPPAPIERWTPPASPATPEGLKAMLDSTVYQTAWMDANKPHDKIAVEPQLTKLDEKHPSLFLTDAAAKATSAAAALRKLSLQNAPGLDATSKDTVTASYERDGKLVQSGFEAANEITKTINKLVADSQIRVFLADKATELEAKHKDATAIRELLKPENSPVVDRDGAPLYSPANNMVPAKVQEQLANSATQLDKLAKYYEAVVTILDTPAESGNKLSGWLNKAAKSVQQAEGAVNKNAPKPAIPFLSQANQTLVEATAEDVQVAINRFEKYVKLNGFPVTTPQTALLANPRNDVPAGAKPEYSRL